jgi:hypothetical protein
LYCFIAARFSTEFYPLSVFCSPAFALGFSFSDVFSLFSFLFFPSPLRVQTTDRPDFLQDVIVPLRDVVPLLPEVAAIPADVDDLHCEVWNLLRDPNIF